MTPEQGKCYDHTNKNLRVIEWVSCEKMLPEEGKLLAVIGNCGFGKFVSAALFDGERFHEPEAHGYEDGLFWEIEHINFWMELPEGPK